MNADASEWKPPASTGDQGLSAQLAGLDISGSGQQSSSLSATAGAWDPNASRAPQAASISQPQQKKGYGGYGGYAASTSAAQSAGAQHSSQHNASTYAPSTSVAQLPPAFWADGTPVAAEEYPFWQAEMQKLQQQMAMTQPYGSQYGYNAGYSAPSAMYPQQGVYGGYGSGPSYSTGMPTGDGLSTGGASNDEEDMRMIREEINKEFLRDQGVREGSAEWHEQLALLMASEGEGEEEGELPGDDIDAEWDAYQADVAAAEDHASKVGEGSAGVKPSTPTAVGTGAGAGAAGTGLVPSIAGAGAPSSAPVAAAPAPAPAPAKKGYGGYGGYKG